MTPQSKKVVLIVDPHIRVLGDSGDKYERTVPGTTLSRSPILEFLAKECREDYGVKRLGLNHYGCGPLRMLLMC